MPHRLADDVAAPDDDGVRALDGDAREFEHTDTARRRAGAQSRRAEHEPPCVHGVEPVHVLARVDALQHFLFIGAQPLRQRKLHENPMHGCVCVQGIDARDQLLLCRIGRQGDVIRDDAELRTRLLLVADVDLRGGISADDDDGEPRVNALRLELRDRASRVLFDFRGKFLARQYACHMLSSFSVLYIITHPRERADGDRDDAVPHEIHLRHA